MFRSQDVVKAFKEAGEKVRLVEASSESPDMSIIGAKEIGIDAAVAPTNTSDGVRYQVYIFSAEHAAAVAAEDIDEHPLDSLTGYKRIAARQRNVVIIVEPQDKGLLNRLSRILATA